MKIEDVLKEMARATSRDLTTESAAIRVYAAQLAVRLIEVSGQPGYIEAAEACANMVLMRAGLGAINAADASDARWRGIVTGILLAGVQP